MSKVLKTVGTIAGVVALSFAIPGFGAAVGIAGAGATATASAALSASIASIASVVSAVANTAAQLTAKKPPARGAVNSVLVEADAPSPYLMGRTYFGGVLRHDVGYGGRVNKVDNPYRGMVLEYSVAGPVDGLEALHFDHSPLTFAGTAATGYYAGFLYRSFQLGNRPEAAALPAQWPSMPGWGAASKLSSKAAVLWGLKFDKDGKRFAGGVPLMGAVWRGVKVYDPRLDSTYPGGSGPQRRDDEATWAYSERPALHALTYALGRHVNGVKVMGVGLPVDGIDVPSFVAGANVEDANDWKVGGVIFEPGDRWDNLKNICAAGSAEPVFSGGRLSYKQDAPRVSLATITRDDLAEGPVKVREVQTWRDRLNGIVPKFRSEAHKWGYVASAEVTVTGYRTQDGEPKVEEIQWNLVQGDDQVAQLAAYKLVNGRERVIDLPLKAAWRIYQPGDLLTIDIPEEELDAVDAVMVNRTVDPATLTVMATFLTEQPGKHDFALAAAGTLPPLPVLLSPEDRDAAAAQNGQPSGFEQALILNSYVSGLGGSPLTAVDAGTTATISIAAHDRVYADKTVAVEAGTVTGRALGATFMVFYDDEDRSGGSVTYGATIDGAQAFNSPAFPARHFVGYITTPADGAPGTGGGGAGPPGSGGGELLP